MSNSPVADKLARELFTKVLSDTPTITPVVADVDAVYRAIGTKFDTTTGAMRHMWSRLLNAFSRLYMDESVLQHEILRVEELARKLGEDWSQGLFADSVFLEGATQQVVKHRAELEACAVEIRWLIGALASERQAQ